MCMVSSLISAYLTLYLKMSRIIYMHLITDRMQPNPSSNHLDCEPNIKELFYLLVFNVILTQLYTPPYQRNIIDTEIHGAKVRDTYHLF